MGAQTIFNAYLSIAGIAADILTGSRSIIVYQNNMNDNRKTIDEDVMEV